MTSNAFVVRLGTIVQPNELRTQRKVVCRVLQRHIRSIKAFARKSNWSLRGSSRTCQHDSTTGQIWIMKVFVHACTLLLFRSNSRPASFFQFLLLVFPLIDAFEMSFAIRLFFRCCGNGEVCCGCGSWNEMRWPPFRCSFVKQIVEETVRSSDQSCRITVHVHTYSLYALPWGVCTPVGKATYVSPADHSLHNNCTDSTYIHRKILGINCLRSI